MLANNKPESCKETTTIEEKKSTNTALRYISRLVRGMSGSLALVDDRPIATWPIRRSRSTSPLRTATCLIERGSNAEHQGGDDSSSRGRMKHAKGNENHFTHTSEEITSLYKRGKLSLYMLEDAIEGLVRAIEIRRDILAAVQANGDAEATLAQINNLTNLPYQSYDWSRVKGSCCENVIGYMPVPVGVAGPLVIDGIKYYIPMATTEGALVASTSRGCKALADGVATAITGDGMTRAPVVKFPCLEKAVAAKAWIDSKEGQETLTAAFNSSSRYARLQNVTATIAGSSMFVRFKAYTGDAMGMNMVSKGVQVALSAMVAHSDFHDMAVVSLSGNYCADKKPAAINWTHGRGKSVVAEAVIPACLVESVLKCTVDDLVTLSVDKILVGSAMAGTIGGFNTHAANIVAAIFIATGQDPAQVVESANCITLLAREHDSLRISVTMPSLEVGTVGGGTVLCPQQSMLRLLGVDGAHSESPGNNSRRLACIIAAATLAGELSAAAALAAGHAVRAHMRYNRSGVFKQKEDH